MIGTEPEATTRAALVREIADGVAAIAGRHRCAVARRVHHSGISLGHLQILWILQEHGPLPVSRLAEWLGIGAPNATGLLDRMEQRGLVERARDQADRRVVHVRTTDLGRATVADLDGWRAELIEQIVDPLPTEQLEVLAARLEQLNREAAALAAHGASTGASPDAPPTAGTGPTARPAGGPAR
jgi:DNA-binding MarR family transcriptional regulator